jgi:signal transduction histidine kinase
LNCIQTSSDAWGDVGNSGELFGKAQSAAPPNHGQPMITVAFAVHDATGELSIKSQLADDGQLLISVADTGVGLPAENVDRLFDAFFTTKPQGTGLGLAITRSIVKSYGGRIWATSDSRRGATFKFTLPSTLAAVA